MPTSPHTGHRLRFALPTALVVTSAFVGAAAMQPQQARAADQNLTIPATADTYASYREPGQQHGDWKQVHASLSDQNRGYLSFDTTDIVPEGMGIASLSLRLFVLENLQPNGVVVHPAPNTWKENTLTMDSAPRHESAVLSQRVPAVKGQWVSIPLATRGSLDENGISNFEVLNDLPDSSFTFATQEAGKSPQLVVTLRDAQLLRVNDVDMSLARGGGLAPAPAPTTTASATPSASPAAATPAAPASGRAFDVSNHNPRGKKVFAHYFTPYPISIDNEPVAKDYYSVHYLNPQGESGKFAAAGGLVRDRPIGRDPLPGDFATTDHRTEIEQAKQGGLDGFTLNLLDVDGSNWARAQNMMNAADAAGSFSIIPMPDMTAIGWQSPQQMAAMIQRVAEHPSAERLDDGRLVLSPYYADLKDVSYWKATIEALNARGTRVAFIPTFVDWPADAQGFASISHGFSMWGGRSPGNIYDVYGPRAKALGVKWMQPISVQDVRPVAGIYDESMNLSALRKSWQVAIDGDADYAVLNTWNDYSETSGFAPSAEHGWAFLDASAYYLSRFKSGSEPSLRRDSLVLTHRKQPFAATPTGGQSKLVKLRDNSSPAVDQVELMAYMTAPGTVSVTVGGRTTSWEAPAGVSVHTVPLMPGKVSAVATRNGQETTRVESDDVVTTTPKVQDLQYVASSSLR